jgi:hypothetical protein
MLVAFQQAMSYFHNESFAKGMPRIDYTTNVSLALHCSRSCNLKKGSISSSETMALPAAKKMLGYGTEVSMMDWHAQNQALSFSRICTSFVSFAPFICYCDESW